MPFKHDWEKKDSFIRIDDEIIKEMVKTALSDYQLSSYELLSGGCANLNFKLNVANDQKPYVLRIYLRDKDAAYREQKIAELLKKTVPIPTIYFIGDCNGYRYALTEFMPGIPLRDLLLSNPQEDANDAMYEAGTMLGNIAHHTFEIAGFFDKNLNVAKPLRADGYSNFALESLQHPTVITQLGPVLITTLTNIIQKNKSLFPDNSQKYLVHADYDPANILVAKLNGQWKITAILDWEFAFSGSWLCDVANMTRYAHQVSPSFEQSFIHGVTAGGLVLPDQWKKTTHLLNLLSLLSCLAACPPLERPGQCADILALIRHIVREL